MMKSFFFIFVFCLALYTEEVLQTFVMILCKIICRNYLCKKKKKFYSSEWFLKNQIFSVFP